MISEYIYHAINYSLKSYKNLLSDYFSSKKTYELIEKIIEKLNLYKNDLENYSNVEIQKFIYDVNRIEEYVLGSVPKNYPNEIGIVLKSTIQSNYPDFNPQLFITQQPNFSYHYLPIDLFDSIKNTAFFCIPKYYKNEILLHSVLFHELGHYFDFSYLKKSNIIYSELIPPDITFKYLMATDHTINTLWWIRELFADYMSICISPFSAFFSEYEAIFSNEIANRHLSISESHPHGYLRLLLIYNYIISECKRFIEEDDIGKKVFCFIVKCKKEYEDKFEADNLNIGMDILELFQDKILRDIDFSFCVTHKNSNINKFVNEITYLIPPVLTSADSYQEIILAGWVVYYFYRDDLNKRANITDDNRLLSRKLINNLVRKSILNKYYTDLWKEANETIE